MSHVVLAWELGSNLGHLAHLIPLARRLRAGGHTCTLVVREPHAVALFGAVDCRVLRSPRLPPASSVGQPPANYADLLLRQGWDAAASIRSALAAWLTLFRAEQPDAVVLDYAPLASAAARLLNHPRILIGTPFELPPAAVALPNMPGVRVDVEAAINVEKQVLANLNAACSDLGVEKFGSLHALLNGGVFLTTVPELDPYPSRPVERYIGWLCDPVVGSEITWPTGNGKIFAYLRESALRQQSPRFMENILGVLADCGAAVICYAPGIPDELCRRFENARYQFASRPVRLASVLREADLCVSYAPAATTVAALQQGVPQLLLPVHLESQLTAQRVEWAGLGRVVDESSNAAIRRHLSAVLTDISYKLRARTISRRYAHLSPQRATQCVLDAIQRAVVKKEPERYPASAP